MEPDVQLSLPREPARLLAEADDFSAALNSALETLAGAPRVPRCSVTLFNPDIGQIDIQASCGLNARERGLGSYAPGECATGSVIASGAPPRVADAGREPLFLNRTRCRDLDREKISFVCVPIRLCGQTAGTISIEHPADPARSLCAERDLLLIVASLLARAALESRGDAEAANETPRPPGFVGASTSMRQVYAQIEIVAPSSTTALVQGESGAGKELAARAIHEGGPRKNAPFVSLNCAALPENLIESELFGHERGAFTGADHLRKGRFELADGGALFLDEIGELSPLAQAKLPRVLQDKSFERLGGMRAPRVDARLIVATNRDLAEMVERG